MDQSLQGKATAMTAAELQELLEKAGGELWRKLIVVHQGQKTIAEAVFMLPDIKIRDGAIAEFVTEMYGYDAVYFLVDVIRLGYEETSVTKSKLVAI